MKKKSTTIKEHIESEEEHFLLAISKCRNCTHIRMAHTFLVDDKGKCIDATISKEGIYEQCLCRKYAPADNLKYLEWQYEQKHKRKKKEKKK